MKRLEGMFEETETKVRDLENCFLVVTMHFILLKEVLKEEKGKDSSKG